MKLQVTAELRSRLGNAAANGSGVARDILKEIKSGKDSSEIIRGGSNYFGTKRKRYSQGDYNQIKIIFTACTKDVTNEKFPDRNNPQAPWYTENRADLDPATFVKCFKNLGDYDDDEIAYFANSISVDSKITVKLYTQMADIHEAYLGTNYSPVAQYGVSTLHNSCMRDEEKARNAADFYYNFAGAQIIVAKDAGNNIMGRAIVWRNALHKSDAGEIIVSILDRVYFTHDFVREMINDYARNIGIQLRKHSNDNTSATNFSFLNIVRGIEVADRHGQTNELHFYIRVPASKWHKHGAPYMDTFSYLVLRADGSVILSNKQMSGCFAELRSTYAKASREKYICPSCNKVHSNLSSHICEACKSKIMRSTVFGEVILGGTTEYKGVNYPAKFFKRGRPTAALSLYLQLEKLYT
jgi:NAD-dependent SIR2 family protein deacetylase